jgi:hypothetical protein
MQPAAPARVPARRLVDDLASVVIVDQHGNVSMSDWRVNVHGDATYSGGRFRKDEPLPLVIGEVEKIGFVVYLEVQLISPLFMSPEVPVVILSGVDGRKAAATESKDLYPGR